MSWPHRRQVSLELGAVYVPPLDADWFQLVVHAAVALPTAPFDGNEEAVALDSSVGRLTELYAASPRSASLRIGISPMIHVGPVLLRGDVRVDDNVYALERNIQGAVDLGLGVGYDLGLAIVMTELSSEVRTNFDAEVGAVTVRFELGHIRPYAAAILVLDSAARRVATSGYTLGVSWTAWEPRSEALHLSHRH